jgi:hypothetical protein
MDSTYMYFLVISIIFSYLLHPFPTSQQANESALDLLLGLFVFVLFNYATIAQALYSVEW